MRTITTITKVYSFGELSEEGKQKVFENLYDINVDHNWWEWTLDDAANIGLEIKEFDITHNTILGELMYDPAKVKRLVIENHGKTCETYKYVDGFDMRTNVDNYEFKYGLLEEYLSILNKEHEYLTSEEAIIETIQCNEYEFNDNGDIC